MKPLLEKFGDCAVESFVLPSFTSLTLVDTQKACNMQGSQSADLRLKHDSFKVFFVTDEPTVMTENFNPGYSIITTPFSIRHTSGTPSPVGLSLIL